MADRDLFASEAEVPDIGPNTTIAALREEAAHCTRCHLYKHATQTVFGEGPEDARIVMVGEVPGDQEDLQGRPFVGPAGRLLDRAMEEAAHCTRCHLYKHATQTGLRRRAGRCAHRHGGRGAGRPGGPARAAVRRARGQAA